MVLTHSSTAINPLDLFCGNDELLMLIKHNKPVLLSKSTLKGLGSVEPETMCKFATHACS